MAEVEIPKRNPEAELREAEMSRLEKIISSATPQTVMERLDKLRLAITRPEQWLTVGEFVIPREGMDPRNDEFRNFPSLLVALGAESVAAFVGPMEERGVPGERTAVVAEWFVEREIPMFYVTDARYLEPWNERTPLRDWSGIFTHEAIEFRKRLEQVRKERRDNMPPNPMAMMFGGELGED